MPISDLEIDIYPVGALAHLQRAWRYLTARKFPAALTVSWSWRIDRARIELRNSRRSVFRNIRARNWRALRNHFNGYLAEPREFPPGDYHRRCGTGWTKRNALRSLERRLPSTATRPSSSTSDQDWEEPRPLGHVCSEACTHTRPDFDKLASGSNPSQVEGGDVR